MRFSTLGLQETFPYRGYTYDVSLAKVLLSQRDAAAVPLPIPALAKLAKRMDVAVDPLRWRFVDSTIPIILAVNPRTGKYIIIDGHHRVKQSLSKYETPFQISGCYLTHAESALVTRGRVDSARPSAGLSRSLSAMPRARHGARGTETHRRKHSRNRSRSRSPRALAPPTRSHPYLTHHDMTNLFDHRGRSRSRSRSHSRTQSLPRHHPGSLSDGQLMGHSWAPAARPSHSSSGHRPSRTMTLNRYAKGNRQRRAKEKKKRKKRKTHLLSSSSSSSSSSSTSAVSFDFRYLSSSSSSSRHKKRRKSTSSQSAQGTSLFFDSSDSLLNEPSTEAVLRKPPARGYISSTSVDTEPTFSVVDRPRPSSSSSSSTCAMLSSLSSSSSSISTSFHQRPISDAVPAAFGHPPPHLQTRRRGGQRKHRSTRKHRTRRPSRALMRSSSPSETSISLSVNSDLERLRMLTSSSSCSSSSSLELSTPSSTSSLQPDTEDVIAFSNESELLKEKDLELQRTLRHRDWKDRLDASFSSSS